MAHFPFLHCLFFIRQFILRSLPRIQNKRFGNDRKNFGSKKPDQSNKKVTDEKNAEKKDIDIKEENKVENTDVNQSVR